ncbi:MULTISPECIES: peptidyl-tRNA hydrolase Pth2 [Methanobacterium]|uniref:Peptidyl-tRNA hydrolase n=1 Tax=Methanobacterium formicicum TaxID=2162 RepID=A0A090I5A5_METFO|nr:MULTISPECIES: peptidyl-tRNA hydrolase Pth2 [Methanobacterium]AIS31627.1 peptidyl-tRNA hydrolase [Methanobacterium formicicum]KUK75577.1 MAG: Peptidyl-tRNA hydrolase [Methanobacterium sp. 42_16]MDD4811109.1 peptidyl-tRNA hydrolase Pth2 [Methanobacterium formicicum]MDH2658658.1 peptidyl-tRNA hydrolase Pth2 [Methanobacterium formicicum]CEA13125.1 peptidyl-tRNA hydrolase [Methanobacterium formicicum]
MKQVMVMRADLKMSKGKLAAQACHASLGAYKKADERTIREWELEGGKKVVVQVKSQEELFQVYELVKAAGIPSFLVTDAGHTELPPSTVTGLGIGPDKDEKIDKITQDLKLLK